MVPSDSQKNPWIFCSRPRPQARLRLFCIPFSGSGASLYREWPDAMGDEIEVLPIQLPGRESRFREPRETDAIRVVKTIVDAIETLLDKPYALFGYSLGAILAFEICREVRNRNLAAPVHLFVAAMRAPHTPPVHPPLSILPDEEFVQQVEYYYRPDNEAWKILQLRELLLPILRDDFKLADNYVCEDGDPLSCPIDVFAGQDDIGAPTDRTKRWAELTTGYGDYHAFAGGHFFIDTEFGNIQKIIREKLKAYIR